MTNPEIQTFLDKHGYDKIDLKAVLIDMDGVLYDSMKNHANAWYETISALGIDFIYMKVEPVLRQSTYYSNEHSTGRLPKKRSTKSMQRKPKVLTANQKPKPCRERPNF